MLNVTVDDAVTELNAATTVTTADDTAVGVPDNTPEPSFNVKPAGNADVAENVADAIFDVNVCDEIGNPTTPATVGVGTATVGVTTCVGVRRSTVLPVPKR